MGLVGLFFLFFRYVYHALQFSIWGPFYILTNAITLNRLIRNGIPSSFRQKVWLSLPDAAKKKSIFLESYYLLHNTTNRSCEFDLLQILMCSGCTCPEMAQTTMKSLCNRVCYSLIVLRVKDYAIKALVNKIDYLGSVTVTYKVNEFVDEKVDQVAGTELHHFLQFHLQLPYMYYIPEAEKALGGDLQPEQSPSSASKTGDSPSNAKEVDEANSPSLV
ncbi:unnamed protein product [Brassica rapa]|uniref:Uncharacterized protein n=3 Tax=Brassica TaxID=3705 RepID=A0A8D9GRT9_BRACM|nr:unnamed protein product [Brassica rapa]